MDELKDELQSKIADYSKMAESGKKTKPKETGFMALSEENKFIFSTTEGTFIQKTFRTVLTSLKKSLSLVCSS